MTEPLAPSADVVEVFRDMEGCWRWRRKAPNGRTIATAGEAFDSRRNARRAATRANPDAKLRLLAGPTD